MSISLYLQGFMILTYFILLSILLLKIKVTLKIGVNLLVYVINHRLFLPFQTDEKTLMRAYLSEKSIMGFCFSFFGLHGVVFQSGYLAF